MDTSFSHRLERLQHGLLTARLDCIAAIAGPNLYYLTGVDFFLGERPVVAFFPAAGNPVFVVPLLEETRLQAQLPYAAHIFAYDDTAGPAAAFAAAARKLAPKNMRLGVEARRMRVMELRLIEAAFPKISIVAADEIFAALRLIKTAAETALIRQAVRIAESALAETLSSIRVGVSEREVAAELTLQILRAGSDGELPFQPLVLSGPNSALPHAVASGRLIEPGDLVVVDWGASASGYFSDLTRTFAVGEVNIELRRIHELVLEANTAARAAVRPGVSCSEVDAAARRVIASAGYAEFFTHRTGHGLGLEAHEEPAVNGTNDQRLAPGMIFTIEPGIYLPGRGGVRIEDDVLVTDSGAESLSICPRALEML